MAGEVATVDRRHVRRQQWLQGFRVVPIEEMAAVAFELAQRAYRCLQPLNPIDEAEPSEFERARGGQVVEPK